MIESHSSERILSITNGDTIFMEWGEKKLQQPIPLIWPDGESHGPQGLGVWSRGWGRKGNHILFTSLCPWFQLHSSQQLASETQSCSKSNKTLCMSVCFIVSSPWQVGSLWEAKLAQICHHHYCWKRFTIHAVGVTLDSCPTPQHWAWLCPSYASGYLLKQTNQQTNKKQAKTRHSTKPQRHISWEKHSEEENQQVFL